MRAAEKRQTIPAYPVLNAVYMLPTLCFSGAFVTDVAYWRTSEIQWANFSAWLLAIGMAFGGLWLIVELVELFRTPRRRRRSTDCWGIGVIAVALSVALTNNFVHARDGWTSVVPSGLILSAMTVALMIVSSGIIANSNRSQIGELL